MAYGTRKIGKPSISYVIQVMDLSVLTGWEHESFGIGDVVTVDDKDLGIRISTRIIRMDYNVQEPWKTVIELSTKLKELQSGFLEDDVVEINADARVATRNGSRIRADGFYSYSAAGDSKHQIKVKDRKSALVRMSFQEMAYGIGGKRM